MAVIARPRSATTRYRVGRVAMVFDGRASAPEEESAVLFGVREYRTREAAEAYRDLLASAGETAVLQVGVLQWMPPEEAADLLHRLGTEHGYDYE